MALPSQSTLACAVVGERGVFTVDIPTDVDWSKFLVHHLKKKTKKEKPDTVTCELDRMQLFLAKMTDKAWLSSASEDVKRLRKGGTTDLIKALTAEDKELLGEGLLLNALEKMDPPLPLQIHVLVVLPPSNDGPPRKKVKLTQHKTVVYQGPVHLEAYSVPMESIKAYKSLEASLSSPHDTVRPLCLLYGPRQFGKTTIAHRLWNFVKGFPSVFVNFCTLTPTNTKSEDTFWGALSRGSAASSREFEAMLQERGERVWLVIDEMDVMFRNEKLTSKFLDVLRNWQTSPYFFGFLGVGTHDLVKLPQMQSGRRGVGPFNLCNLMVKVERFSSEQMVVFFQLIEPSYPFSESTRAAIMNYSAGAPGVFGSLIRCSIDRLKCTVERYEWEHWLKIDSFYAYLETYNWTYSRLRDDLVDFLDYSDWKSLISLLRNCVRGETDFKTDVLG